MMFESQVQPTMRFLVPGVPVPKGRARVMRNKHTGKTHGVTPAKTVNFEATVRLVASAARPANWPMRCEYRVDMHIIRARRGRGDGSNILKAVEDACNGVTWIDDERVSEFHVTRGLDPLSPCTQVTITAIRVRCCNKTCGNALTFYPDDKGRCEQCQGRAR